MNKTYVLDSSFPITEKALEKAVIKALTQNGITMPNAASVASANALPELSSKTFLIGSFTLFRGLDKWENLMITEKSFFLSLTETIYCDPLSESSHRDDSDEGSQLMFLCRFNKSYVFKQI